MHPSKTKAKQIALLGIFTALAFILGFIESLIPPFTGIPGVKAGFANIVTMVALYLLKAGDSVSGSVAEEASSAHTKRTARDISYSPDIIIPSFYSLVCALGISTVRILLGGVTYHGMSAMLYGLAGAFCSLLVMFLLARTRRFSVTAVSVAGGVAHNAAQLAVSLAMLGDAVLYYLPVLIVSGLAAGAIIGIIAAVLIQRLHAVL